MSTANNDDLRQRAEKRLGAKKAPDLPHLSPEEVQKLIHELQVHQVELELQNEELHQAMAELAKTTANYQDFYELTPVGYLTLDEAGRIRESNLTAATLLGTDRSLLLTKSFQLLIAPESLPAWLLFLKKIFAEPRKRSCELQLLKKGGVPAFIQLEGMAVINSAPGTAPQCRVVMIDITQRRQMEMQMESFSYSISHDLREPLRAIDGFSRMLLRDLKGKLEEEEQRKFNIIREKAKKMEHLINDLLEYSRLGREKQNVIVINLEELATEVWAELRENHPERDITMTISSLPLCQGTAKLIRQVLANLLGNAFKFTQDKQSAAIDVGGYESADECIYYVKDNGIGFDMLYYDKLFQIFRRLHDNEKWEGTGVGLSIVKRIIELHGGRVWAESQLGEGATFYFTLPKKDQDS